jgi:hypothetical protein
MVMVLTGSQVTLANSTDRAITVIRITMVYKLPKDQRSTICYMGPGLRGLTKREAIESCGVAREAFIPPALHQKKQYHLTPKSPSVQVL